MEGGQGDAERGTRTRSQSVGCGVIWTRFGSWQNFDPFEISRSLPQMSLSCNLLLLELVGEVLSVCDKCRTIHQTSINNSSSFSRREGYRIIQKDEPLDGLTACFPILLQSLLQMRACIWCSSVGQPKSVLKMQRHYLAFAPSPLRDTTPPVGP